MIDKNSDNSWPLLYCHIEQTAVMLQSALTMNLIDIAWDNMILPQFRYYEIRSDSWLKWKSLILEAWLQNMFPSIRFGEVCLFCFFPRSRNCSHTCHLRHCEANWSETSSSRCWIWLLWGAKSWKTRTTVAHVSQRLQVLVSLVATVPKLEPLGMFGVWPSWWMC